MKTKIHLLPTAALSLSLALPASGEDGDEGDTFIENGWDLIAPIELSNSEITLEEGTPEPQNVAELVEPEVTEQRYLVAGEVRYTDADGYLELWNFFGEGRYFSRTMGEIGPMAKLDGTSDWRIFMLPFNADEGMIPDRLLFNVVLPGGGEVELRKVKLYQTDTKLQAQGAAGASGDGSKGGPSSPWFYLAVGLLIASVGFASVALLRRRKTRRELRKMQVSML